MSITPLEVGLIFISGKGFGINMAVICSRSAVMSIAMSSSSFPHDTVAARDRMKTVCIDIRVILFMAPLLDGSHVTLMKKTIFFHAQYITPCSLKNGEDALFGISTIQGNRIEQINSKIA